MFASLAAWCLLAVVPVSVTPQTAPAPDKGQSPAWLKTLSPLEPGTFPPPRPFEAAYRLTWSDVEAGRAEVRCAPGADGDTIRTTVKTATRGAARLLYKMDGLGVALADRRTLRPVQFDQKEDRGSKRNVAKVVFAPEGATRTLLQTDKDGKPLPRPDAAKDARPKRFDYPGLVDIHGTLLQLRSQTLAAGEERVYAVMSATSPYLAKVKVVGRGKVKVRAGEYPAIECALSLQKINKRGELENYKSLKQARAWLSDDADRILLKVETQIFIGSVNMELESVKFAPGGGR